MGKGLAQKGGGVEARLRVLIIGAGRIGMHLIRYISMSDDNQLTVIEKKPERCRELSNVSDGTILNAAGSKPDILKKAESSQTDLLLFATSDDQVNITSTR